MILAHNHFEKAIPCQGNEHGLSYNLSD